jgi:hypothetical protein
VVLEPTLKGEKNQSKHKLIRRYPANPRTGAKPNSKKNDKWAFAKVGNGEWTGRQHEPIHVPTTPCENAASIKDPFEPYKPMPKRDESNTTIDTGNKQQPRLIGDKLETLKPPPEEPPPQRRQ